MARSSTLERRNKWAVIIAAPFVPVLAGIARGTFGDLFSDLHNMVAWVAFAFCAAPSFGFGIWLTWRASFATGGRAKLILYTLLFGPLCVSHSIIVECVSLFVQSGDPEAFDLRIPFLGGASIASNFQPDYFAFVSLVGTLWLIRLATGISLVRPGESLGGPARVTVRSMLVVTFVAAITIVVLRSTVASNASILANLELAHSPFHWLDISNIVTPAASGIVTAIVLFLLATVSRRRPFHASVMVAMAFALLLVPEAMRKMLFVLIGFAPSGASVLPNIFNVAGALSMLVTCAGCLLVLRSSGMIVARRGRQSK